MRTRLLIGTIVTILSAAQPASAQSKHWTLRQCTEYAVSHNIQIKQRDNQRIQREIQLSTAKNSRLPDLSGSVSERFSFGRGLTVDNTYTNRSTSSTSFSIGTNVPLFTGFKIPNNIKLNQLNLEAATQDLEKAKNDIRMQVAKAFVQILYDMEIADVHLALLVLTQLLELPTPEGFSIVRPNLNNQNILNIPSDPNIIYQEALLFKPEVKAEQLRLDASEKNIKIAQAALYPTLSLTGGLQSNYNTISGVPSDGFFSQLKNNFSQYIGLSLNVPIFNRFSTRNSIRSARIDRENQQLQLDNIKKTLYKEIQQVYYNAVAAQAKYESSEVARQSSEDAFTLTQAKYENGKANITEFNEAKNRYLKAESDLVQARYEYLYQTSLLDFYRGKELNF